VPGFTRPLNVMPRCHQRNWAATDPTFSSITRQEKEVTRQEKEY
jgi:hypothetical protein